MSDSDDGNDKLIIDEVLCYVQNKMKILPVDAIVQLCETTFKPEQIEKSKERLFDVCFEENDKTERKTRIGQHKNERNLRDIYSLLEEKGDSAPTYVAKDLNILPPVTIKSLDVSLLLHNNTQLQTEVRIMKQAIEIQKQTSQDIFDMMKTMEKRLKNAESGVFPGISKQPDNSVSDMGNPSGNNDSDGVLRLRGPQATPPGTLNPSAPPFGKSVQPLYSAMAQGKVFRQRGNSIMVDEDGFCVIGPNGKPLRMAAPQQKKKQSEIGKSNRNALSAATRIVKANVFATRYKPDTTEDDVKSDLKADPRIKDLDICVEKVKTKYDTYASFHVTCVCKEDESKLFYMQDLWPPGILYREWKEKRVTNNQGGGGFAHRGGGFAYRGVGFPYMR